MALSAVHDYPVPSWVNDLTIVGANAPRILEMRLGRPSTGAGLLRLRPGYRLDERCRQPTRRPTPPQRHPPLAFPNGWKTDSVRGQWAVHGILVDWLPWVGENGMKADSESSLYTSMEARFREPDTVPISADSLTPQL